MNILTFNGVELQPLKQQNQIWLTSSELAIALGYARSDYVTAIYNRKSDEFTPSMTQVIEVTENDKLMVSEKSSNLVKRVRIFSLRGCHLIAMFARTKVAKDFRQWVLDILDKEVGEPVQVTTHRLSTVKERNGLVKTCEWLVRTASYLDYSEVYNLIHHRFNVDKLSELTTEQVGYATEYLQGLLLQVIARQRGFNPQDPTPPSPMYRTDIGKFYDGALWTRILEPDEHIVKVADIPKLLIDEPYIDNETLTAINYASSARLASMLKNPPFLSALDNAKEV